MEQGTFRVKAGLAKPIVAEISRHLGEPMVGIEISTIPEHERMQARRW